MSSYVIIGASRGLGYQYLKTLSADPANTIVGTARTPSDVVNQLSADGISTVHVVKGDLDDYESMNAAAKEVAKLTNGAVDYLIINGAYMGNDTAALSPTQVTGIEKLFQEEMEKMFLTNTIGPVYAINAFLPLIRTGKVKKITVISSGMADPDFILTAGVAPAIAYSASKAAVNIIVSKFAVELKPDSITLLALSPGLVDTRGPEGAAEYHVLTQAFRSYEPEFKGPITPEQSVKAQLKVIKNVSIKDTGAFLSHLGNKRWLSASGVGDEVVE